MTSNANHRVRLPAAFATMASVLLFSHSPVQGGEQDDRIVAAAKASYVYKQFLADDKIITESKDGVVTLSGMIQDESHKRLAYDTVSGLPGVLRVDNRIEVKEPTAVHSDTWLHLKVKTALAIHRSVSAYSTGVKMNDGVVTLTGEATSLAQKDLAAEYAADVDGVKGVKNEMTVAAVPVEIPVPATTETIDDPSINAQVKVALWAHRSTHAIEVTTRTVAGVVTLRGNALNAAARDLAAKIAGDIHGVKDVVNEIVIAPATSAN